MFDIFEVTLKDYGYEGKCLVVARPLTWPRLAAPTIGEAVASLIETATKLNAYLQSGTRTQYAVAFPKSKGLPLFHDEQALRWWLRMHALHSHRKESACGALVELSIGNPANMRIIARGIISKVSPDGVHFKISSMQSVESGRSVMPKQRPKEGTSFIKASKIQRIAICPA